MWALLGISLASFSGLLFIWFERLISFRQGKSLDYHNFYITPLIRVKLERLYNLHLRERLITALNAGRSLLFNILRRIFLLFKTISLKFERRFLTLMNMVRGKGKEKNMEPSNYIGELKNHKEEIRNNH